MTSGNTRSITSFLATTVSRAPHAFLLPPLPAVETLPSPVMGPGPWLAWAPRSLLRCRRQRQQSYPVGGILGCAFLVSRTLYERAGGFDEAYFAYYDEVDYCLRARGLGMHPRVEPAAEIAHVGHRGFGGGFSRAAAYLKARNLWLLGVRRVGAVGRLVFVPGYFVMLLASVLLYAVRGRFDVVASMGSGMTAAFEGKTGPPPPTIFDRSAAKRAPAASDDSGGSGVTGAPGRSLP